MQGLSMMITKAEGAMLHQLLFGDLPEDSRAYPSEERIKTFHVKLDVFLAVSNYGERPTVQQLSIWDAE